MQYVARELLLLSVSGLDFWGQFEYNSDREKVLYMGIPKTFAFSPSNLDLFR